MNKRITNEQIKSLTRSGIWSLGWDMIERGASHAEVASVIKRWEKLNNEKYIAEE